jgi:hypothetical protein
MWCLALLAFTLRAPETDEPPIAGRPPGFSGAVGDFRHFTTTASPTDVQVGDRIRFIVKIACTGTCRKEPVAPRLRELPEFAERFVIEEPMPAMPAVAAPSDTKTWEFGYTLRPRSADVTEIPALRFDYYRPGIIPPEKGYQSRYSDSIPLTVHARKAMDSVDVASDTRLPVPESVFHLDDLTETLAAGATRAPDVAASVSTNDKAWAANLVTQAEQAFRTGIATRENPSEARKQFAKAVEAYRELTQHGYCSAALLQNLGNAYLLAGELPSAILAYRQALKVTPENELIAANLDYARSLVIHRPDRPWDWAAFGARRAPVLKWSALAALVIGGAFLAYGWTRRRRVLLRLSFVGFAIALALALGLWAAQKRHRHDNAVPVVVVAVDDVPVHSGDGRLYPIRYPNHLNRGVEGRLLAINNRWVQIELSDGSVGWVPAEKVLIGT